MTADEQPVIGGFALTWREFPAPRLARDVETDRVGAAGEGDGRAFGMWVLADPDAPLDRITQEEFDQNDERMPYFGLIWPSAETLVARVLAGPRLDGLHVLDLGCGLGPCGFAAAARGARVTFFDWEPRALEIVAASARRQPISPDRVECVVGDWRTPPPIGPFDRILGADVLYEARNAPAVADFLRPHLKPGAEAWIADPGRLHAADFPSLAQAAGLQLAGTDVLARTPNGRLMTLLRLRRPA